MSRDKAKELQSELEASVDFRRKHRDPEAKSAKQQRDADILYLLQRGEYEKARQYLKQWGVDVDSKEVKKNFDALIRSLEQKS